MGFSPSIAAAPTFPLPSLGANLIVAPSSSSTLSVGVLDGLDGAPAAEGRRSLFEIAQFRQSWTLGASQLAGKLGVGGWRHTGLFTAMDAPADSAPAVSGTHGWYATLDQQLWQGAARATPDDPRAAIAAFAQVGRSNPLVQTVTRHDGGGLTFSGFVPRRTSDLFGIGLTRASWRDGHESIGEAFYQLPFTSHLSFVADMQRVFQRDVGFDRRNGTVTTLRTIVSF
jgi:carbohydrate-selective porin OprB